MNELQPLLDLLGGNSGKLAVVIAWIGALRLLAKPFSAWVQMGFSKLLAQVQSTPEPDDDELVRRLLASWPYRAFAFGLDWITSVKLPTTASLTKATEPSEKAHDFNTRAGLILLFCIGAPAIAGCARFTTTQTDVSYENGKPTRTVTTRAQATTLFEAKSALANFKASQTDKTQSASVGALNQESTGSFTNAAVAAGEFIGGIIRASK